MRKTNATIVLIMLLIVGIILSSYSFYAACLFFAGLALLEAASHWLINKLREDFQWLITQKDEYPALSEEGLEKFFIHGYDPELGWVRKPNTQKEELGKFGKTIYHIGKNGSRKNPGHENLPKKISFYGDSFPFGRQVNDNETCEWYLSDFTKTNVLNFAVGNFGLDQALLRLKREFPKNKTKIVVMGIVPSTIVRIMCMWKHYNEYGNTFGFKPRFIIEKGNLKLIRNVIGSKEKFFNYERYLHLIKKHDHFYENKFKKEMIQFPYLISILSDPLRNIRLIYLVSLFKWIKKEKSLGSYTSPMRVIMEINLKLRINLFLKNEYAVLLLEKLSEEFANYGRKCGFIPVFLLMPQKDDILFIRKKKEFYYGRFVKFLQSRMLVIDLTQYLINRKDLDELYSDDNEYGGHYNKFGNKLIAKIIYDKLNEEKAI